MVRARPAHRAPRGARDVGTETPVYEAYVTHPTGIVSACLPDELEAELESYIDEDHLDRSTAVRKLLAEGLDEWRKERALERLEAGEVSFTRAAKLADLNVWDFAQLVRDRDVTWVDDDDVDADLASL